MADVENMGIDEYLKKIGFEAEEIEEILEYANSEIDRKVLHEKVKFLISLGLEARQIRIVLEEDLLFVTEDFELIKENAAVLTKYLDQEEIKNTLETTPEILTVRKEELERNINLLKLVINDEESLKIVIQDRGEILTYKPDYLSDKFTFFVSKGLKENILKIIIENVEVFELDNDEIDVEELKY
ncbi:MAG: hypothetical protein IKJ36_01290 [Clostridia bacterium]|nr:hypothetical protein [Clostridia bacterium]